MRGKPRGGHIDRPLERRRCGHVWNHPWTGGGSGPAAGHCSLFDWSRARGVRRWTLWYVRRRRINGEGDEGVRGSNWVLRRRTQRRDAASETAGVSGWATVCSCLPWWERRLLHDTQRQARCQLGTGSRRVQVRKRLSGRRKEAWKAGHSTCSKCRYSMEVRCKMSISSC